MRRIFALALFVLLYEVDAFSTHRSFRQRPLNKNTILQLPTGPSQHSFHRTSTVHNAHHQAFIPLIRRGSIAVAPILRRHLFSLYSMLGTVKDAISVKSFIGTKRLGKKLLYVSLASVFIAATVDMVMTYRRQQKDATSEWGRYADHPSLRGIALTALVIKMSLYLLTARLINTLPGGDRYPFRRRKNNKTNQQSQKWAARKSAEVRTVCGKEFAESLLRLGPLYIKIGQILSCRKNLLPEEWKAPMERLQDQVPAKSGNAALELAYSAYDGGEKEFNSIFSEFNDVPLAAASLGQVHLAKLKSNNETVALKLQRPRLRAIYDKDLGLMEKIATTVDRFGVSSSAGGVKQSWEEIFNDTEKILYREIDYRSEAENAIRFASDFGLGKNGLAVNTNTTSLDGKALPSAASWIRTPYVYEEYSNERCLVMEYVPSIKISKNDELDRQGIDVDDKIYLADCVARAYLRQFVCGKFFSTDPHPGNLGVELITNDSNNGESVRLVFYDFGQACNLKDDQAMGILHVIEAIVDMNVDNCVDAFIQMGVLASDADLDKVRSKVKDNFETGKVKVKRRRRKGSGKIRDEFVSTDKNETTNTTQKVTVAGNVTEGKVDDSEIVGYFTLPAEYAFVARAISQMDGVGKGLDSEFDFISASAPYLVEVKGSELYLQDEAKKLLLNTFAKLMSWQNSVFGEVQNVFTSIKEFQQDIYERIKKTL